MPGGTDHCRDSQSQPMIPELKLLLSCARIAASREDGAAIGRLLEDGIDWALFARMAIDHGLAGFAGHTLALLAPDAVRVTSSMRFA